MGKNSRANSARKKKNKSVGNRDNKASSSGVYNFVPEAGLGCHICHYDEPWIIGVEDFDPLDYDEGTEFPDIALSPDKPYTLCVINSESVPKTFYISVPLPCSDSSGARLQPGWTRDDKGRVSEVVTLILVVAARCLMSVCTVEVPADLGPHQAHQQIDSDVQPLMVHPSPENFNPEHTFIFPLVGGPFLCTQGIQGSLTHFFAGSLHAVDFRCPVGTPLVAMGAGEVVEVRQSETVSGIHISNLFRWNSVMVRLDSGVVVEYVHIRQNSATVVPGDRVAPEQKICESGDVGFCPEPHLHLQMHMSQEPEAPTLKFALQAQDGSSYFPVAGKYYDANGLASEANSSSSKPIE